MPGMDSASLSGNLDRFIQRSESLLVLMHFHKARAVKARVSNVCTRIGDFGDGPCFHHILFRGCDVPKQELSHNLHLVRRGVLADHFKLILRGVLLMFSGHAHVLRSS